MLMQYEQESILVFFFSGLPSLAADAVQTDGTRTQTSLLQEGQTTCHYAWKVPLWTKWVWMSCTCHIHKLLLFKSENVGLSHASDQKVLQILFFISLLQKLN